ncbi:hypothetical protein [Agitococcus lubricus]|uniref:Uncharacterized protein n=1 Tax=Agitococcus lubricus TaxID=1077255 RepID=A0A2T5IYB5_9GAMM|nr:hypothetical protein [Agitococcus lubricus]PTQ88988.1 hypothetical protein C8N29_1099 [Agitococcus lubricus]
MQNVIQASLLTVALAFPCVALAWGWNSALDNAKITTPSTYHQVKG